MDLRGDLTQVLFRIAAIGIDESNGYDGALGAGGRLERTGHEILNFIAGHIIVTAFRKEDISFSFGHIGSNIENDLDLALEIFFIQALGLYEIREFIEKQDLGPLFVNHVGKRLFVSEHDAYCIKPSLVVRIQDVTPFFGEVLHTVSHRFDPGIPLDHVGGPDGYFVTFFVGMAFGMPVESTTGEDQDQYLNDGYRDHKIES